MEVKSKSWLESVTVWGVIISAVAGILGLFGIIMTAVGRTQAVQPVHFLTPFTVKVEPEVVTNKAA